MGHPFLLLLGPPRLERDGQPVEVDTRKAIALLAYLAVTRQPHSRDALAALLWPDYGQTRARAALRRTLSALNAALGGGALVIDRDNLALGRAQGDHPRLVVDIDQFHQLLEACADHGHSEKAVCSDCLPLLEEAVKLYRDDFLAGFTLRDSPTFDEWQYFQADTLRRELADALERLTEGHSQRGDWQQAIGCARRWLLLDPLHEPAHRRLMQLYTWAGDRAAALRQFRECERVLEQELGVTPLEATLELHTSIKENRLPLPAAPSAPSTERPAAQASPARATVEPHVKESSPLVGRALEWAVLEAAYEGVETDGQLIVLEGEAGIGKTRLAEEFIAHLKASGVRALSGRCYAGEAGLAYSPFIGAFAAVLRQGERPAWIAQLPAHALGELGRLLPEINGFDQPVIQVQDRPQATPGAQARFFEGLSQALLLACGSTPPSVLFLDDLHWADAASLDLLTYLVRRLHGRPLFIIATWRGEQVPSGHRLRLLVAEAQRAEVGRLLPLRRLDQSAVLELARPAQLSGMGADFAGRLYQETEGLPLFVGEYLAALTQGALTSDHAPWSLPGGVRDLLRGRLSAVSETGWQLLNTAAAIGRSFDFDTLREASGRSEEEAITALEELIAQGLVVEVGDNASSLMYDFSHEKLRVLVYDETSLARRRLLHRRIAEALVARSRARSERSTVAAKIASHYQLARQPADAAHYFMLAGEQARTLYANTEALSHFQAALTLGHPDTAVLHEALGDLQTLLGDYAAALSQYEAAARQRPPEARAAIEHKLGNVH